MNLLVCGRFSTSIVSYPPRPRERTTTPTTLSHAGTRRIEVVKVLDASCIQLTLSVSDNHIADWQSLRDGPLIRLQD
ncbi:hypothetical protein JR316_0013036 [Psilocybe cubensis]|uniref:Uncharacterized protein n=1 Tax=Psilocybe cubensis TaxID=181762 RepID=A0ACB8GHM9_PSICU|nr:hypothetical protein JR316_0013036 [Psilocybe cubensis]KAH9474574.1 hypothetical protein JR316_0013036 [Psilocybe cubensis]